MSSAKISVTEMSKPSDLVQGTLDLLLLKLLALEPLHGWAIGIRLKQVSGDVLQVSDGSLYPALHKLEQQGWIKIRLAQYGEQPAGEVLFAYASRADATGERDGELGSAGRRHQRRRPPQ